MKKSTVSILICAIAMTIGSACSTKKNTAASRNYQAFITRYNVYFNGKEHYDETLADMESTYDDDFSRELPIHPADVRGNNDFAQPSGSFTRSTEKAQKSIQLHSIKKRPRREPGRRNDPEYQAWLRREEYNPFLHNAWMLLAESQFMDGDFLGAASTFFYITNHFPWIQSTVTEARIWQARCYCAAGRVNEADAVLGRIKERDLTTSGLRGFYAFVRSATALARGNHRLAMEWLPAAVDWASGQEKRRLRYLLGQVYLREGRYEEARREFEKIEKSVSAPHQMRFNARIRKSEAITGATADRRTLESELNSLRRMTRYESNSAYLDLIHYAMGNIYLSLADTARAINSYAQGVALSERRSTDMAIAAAALGNLYYDMSDYDKAQPYMSQAVAGLPENYPDIKKLKEKSDLLDKLAVYSSTVRTNDSLLRLSELPQVQINAIIDRKIDSLRKIDRERERETRAALSENFSAANGLPATTANAPQTINPTTAGDGSWYFYNRALIESGKQEFRRRWGDRKPEDNWRRSQRNSVAADLTPTMEPSADAPAVERADSLPDVYTREYYLRDIPFEPSQKETLRKATATALYEMGLLLKDYLEDYPAARKPLMRFLDENPGDGRRKEVYYNMFFMAMLENNPVDGERWRRRIVEEYPESNEGMAMSSPRYLEDLREMNQKQEELYEETYRLYLSNDNEGVRKNAAYAREHYPMSPLQPKFMFLDALTYVTDGNAEEFRAKLEEITARYPDADETPLSASWLKGLDSGKELMKSESNPRGWLETRLAPDSAAPGEAIASRLEFTFSDEGPHLVLITFAVNETDPNEMLFQTARYNFNTFSVRDFDLTLSLYGNLGIIRVGGFGNAAEAERYHTLISGASPEVVPPEARIIVISESDYNLLLHGGRTLVDYLNALMRKDDTRVHEAVLPPDEYPPAEEMYDELPSTERETNDHNNQNETDG